MESETAVALLSAGGGLVTGLSVAFFQRRGDRMDHKEQLAASAASAREQHQAENERQHRQFESENERLSQQLAAQAAEANAGRDQMDLLNWRDRRVDAYRAVSNAASRAKELATLMAQADPGNFFAQPKPGAELDDAFAELRVAIDEVDLISGGTLVMVADLLWAAATTLQDVSKSKAAGQEALHQASIRRKEGREPPKDGDLFAVFMPNVEQAAERVEKSKENWTESLQVFERSRKSWAEESRESLGLPD